MAIHAEKLQEMFLADSRIMMQTLRRIARTAEQGELSSEEVDRAFRAAHSLKSEAGFLRISDITATANELENILSSIRAGDGVLDEGVYGKFMNALSLLDAKLNDYYERVDGRTEPKDDVEPPASPDEKRSAPEGSGGLATNYAAENESLEAMLQSSAARGIIREAEQRGEHFYRLELRIETASELLYPRAFLVLNNLEVSATVIATEPGIDKLTDDQRNLRVVVASFEPKDGILRRVNVDEVEVVEAAALSYEELIGGGQITRGLSTQKSAVDISENAEDLEAEVRLIADELLLQAQKLEEPQRGANHEDRVQDVAERVRMLATYLRRRAVSHNEVQLLDSVRKLQQEVVRYAARQGKRLRFVVGGRGALVSPIVGSVFVEAILHLIRNSVDHGIVPLKERVKRGKPPAGTIKVEVGSSPEHVRVRIKDDGTGIDERAVRQAAGVASTEDLLKVISAPGFTTKTTPSESSGRGVGLQSVMHTVVNLLGGKMQLVNRQGTGVEIGIAFPRGADLLEVQLVMHGRALYALPMPSLLGRTSLSIDLIRRDSFGTTYYELEGTTIPVVTPRGRSLRIERFGADSELLLIRGPSGKQALAVDSVVGEEAVVRDGQGGRTIYSRLLGQEAELLLPGLLGDTNG